MWFSSTRTGRRAHTTRSIVAPSRGWIERKRSGHRGPHRCICKAEALIPGSPLGCCNGSIQDPVRAQISPGSRYHCSTKRMKRGVEDSSKHGKHSAKCTVKTTSRFSPRAQEVCGILTTCTGVILASWNDVESKMCFSAPKSFCSTMLDSSSYGFQPASHSSTPVPHLLS